MALNLFKQPGRMVVATASMLMLSACMVGPDFERPAAPASRHYDAQAEQQLAAAGGPPGLQHVDLDRKVDGDWWSAFGSAKLDQVMHKAIDGNLDLEAADATIAQAGEAVAAARGGLSPQLDFGAQGGRQRAAGVPGPST
ncbi:MAG: TolC family protein, partial [Nevskiales bacterium]